MIPTLPGAELIEQGLAGAARGVESVAALLVWIGAPRVRRLGVDVPPGTAAPANRLYELL